MSISVYVLGVLAAFLVSRAFRRRVDALKESWFVIIIYTLICGASWLAFITFGICYIIVRLSEIDFKDTKPPKWL